MAVIFRQSTQADVLCWSLNRLSSVGILVEKGVVGSSWNIASGKRKESNIMRSSRVADLLLAERIPSE